MAICSDVITVLSVSTPKNQNKKNNNKKRIHFYCNFSGRHNYLVCFTHALRRRNTRHKNPQLVAQHCFVASFCRCFPFSPCVINLSRNKNICCGLKKVVAKSRARVYWEQQIFALLLVFHQTHNFSRMPYKSTNQRAAFLQPATNVFVAGQVDQAR